MKANEEWTEGSVYVREDEEGEEKQKGGKRRRRRRNADTAACEGKQPRRLRTIHSVCLSPHVTALPCPDGKLEEPGWIPGSAGCGIVPAEAALIRDDLCDSHSDILVCFRGVMHLAYGVLGISFRLYIPIIIPGAGDIGDTKELLKGVDYGGPVR